MSFRWTTEDSGHDLGIILPFSLVMAYCYTSSMRRLGGRTCLPERDLQLSTWGPKTLGIVKIRGPKILEIIKTWGPKTLEIVEIRGPKTLEIEKTWEPKTLEVVKTWWLETLEIVKTWGSKTSVTRI